MPNIKIVFALLVLILLICRASDAGPDVSTYTIVDLGTLGGKNCTAFALNNHSQIVGGSQIASGVTHAFLWDKGKIQDLGVLPGDKGSVAYALNDQGQAVGLSNDLNLPASLGIGLANNLGAHAAVWNNKAITKLPVDGGSMGFGIDNAGNTAGVITHGDVSTAFVLIGTHLTAFGGPFSRVTAIAGAQAAGTFYTARDKSGMTYSHGFVWNAGHVRDLGLIDVVGVNALNDVGQVVGMATFNYALPPQKQHLEAFVWQNGKTRFLGRLPGSHLYSSACGINSSGMIVGWSHAKEGYAEAVLWHNGQVINLNSCARVPHGYMLDMAQAVNDKGQILCRGYTFTGNFKGGSFLLPMGAQIPGEVRHSFLLTPVVRPGVLLSAPAPSPRHDPLRYRPQWPLCLHSHAAH